MKPEINILAITAIIATIYMYYPPKTRALEIDLKDIAQKGTKAINNIKDRIAEVHWEDLPQKGIDAIDQAKSHVAEVDWQGLHQKGIDAVDQARSQIAEVDWEGLHQNGIDTINQAGSQIAEVDWQSLLDKCRNAFDETMLQLSQVEWEILFKKITEILENIKDQVIAVEWSKLSSEVQDWIKEHPADAAFYVISGVVFFYPSVIAGPFLELLGFASKGPIAGSLASLAQATIGDVPARHIFSYLQSAAMGGYGVFPVETAVRGIAAAAVAIKFQSDIRIANGGACPEDDPGHDHEGWEDRKVCPLKSGLKSKL